MAEKIALSERAHTAFGELTASAKNLNAASDELRAVVTQLDEALHKLNLGVSAWVTITSGGDDRTQDFWSRDIGYTRVGRTWGIALREVEGNEHFPEDEKVESWSFNEAPRWLRVQAVGKIPELLESLVEQADSTTKNIKLKTVEAKELATAINSAVAASAVAQHVK